MKFLCARTNLSALAMKVTCLALVGCFLWPTVLHANDSENPKKVAPNFSLIDSNGKMHNLSDYKGKFVVLEWFNPDCPFVKKHYGSNNMQSLQKRYTEQGVVWLTIDSSAPGRQGYLSAQKANEVIADRGIQSTALLLDPEGQVGQLYHAKTTPSMFVINPEGILIYTGAIDDDDSTDPANAKSASNYVSAALDQARVGKPVAVSWTESYGCSIKYRG